LRRAFRRGAYHGAFGTAALTVSPRRWHPPTIVSRGVV